MAFKFGSLHVSALSLGITAVVGVAAILYYRNASSAGSSGAAPQTASPLFQTAAIPDYSSAGTAGGAAAGSPASGSTPAADTSGALSATDVASLVNSAASAQTTSQVTSTAGSLIAQFIATLPIVGSGGTDTANVTVQDALGNKLSFSGTSSVSGPTQTDWQSLTSSVADLSTTVGKQGGYIAGLTDTAIRESNQIGDLYGNAQLQSNQIGDLYSAAGTAYGKINDQQNQINYLTGQVGGTQQLVDTVSTNLQNQVNVLAGNNVKVNNASPILPGVRAFIPSYTGPAS